ncbi:hypothetical protein B0H12DRAFT_1120556, partial [Mycena haematopus]
MHILAPSTTPLGLLFGHSYRIGGSLELFSAGVHPEVVTKLGAGPLCFPIYWRLLQKFLPLAVTRAGDAHIREFAYLCSRHVRIQFVSLFFVGRSGCRSRPRTSLLFF